MRRCLLEQNEIHILDLCAGTGRAAVGLVQRILQDPEERHSEPASDDLSEIVVRDVYLLQRYCGGLSITKSISQTVDWSIRLSRMERINHMIHDNSMKTVGLYYTFKHALRMASDGLLNSCKSCELESNIEQFRVVVFQHML
ncbi:hypothetical protein IE077_002264 [Cardiosporidium cionae]|uniref:Uncharacterized protein n=1 Tax=Cardiosporidium cionae TaxID=476202 RepID=A0ABQ7JBB9_9APIC|nr:hypothetical protein IE077_002264 [Cardiosporidium cionae]|eukprot:KAF8821254.1 hypothetical protein IE077_002264 [Cardiosporidium cionae]